MSAAEQGQYIEQKRLELSQDFMAVYGTPSGRRVLDYILGTLCHERTPSSSVSKEGLPVHPNADRAMYLLALADMAKHIRNIMDYDFNQRQRPVVHTRRQPQQPYRGTDE